MTTYKYKAISNSGAQFEGVIEAHDREDAIVMLRESCSSVLSLNEVREESPLNISLTGKKVKDKALALVCQQFSIILKSGIPIVRAIELVAEQANDKTLKGILKDVAKDVAAGYSLASGFEMRDQSLPPTFIETIRAGEESGSLELAFSRLAEYYMKKNKIRSKIISALAYPTFVIVVAIIVITVIMIYAVPAFTNSFESMGIDLPWATKLLIGTSDFFRANALFLGSLIVALLLALKIYGNTENGKINLARFRLKIPVVGRITLMSAAGQFASTLSTMLASGLPVIRALSVTGRAMTNEFLGMSVLDVVSGIESGRRIGECMEDSRHFPNLLVEMTKVGEESGSMEETLRVVGIYYDTEVENASTRAVTLLEPIIICTLAVFVVVVLLAVYLPMFSIYGGI